MKKVIGFSLIVVMLLIVLTACESNTAKTETENVVENTVADVAEEKVEPLEDVEAEIEAATKRYFDMVYGDKISEVKASNIKVYEGEERENILEIVDLTENDYAFEIDYEIKPATENDVKDITEYAGTYDKETGTISQKQAYGVMRYNVISKGYDVTSITKDSF